MFAWIRSHKYVSLGGLIAVAVIASLVVRGRTTKKNAVVTAAVERRDLEQIVSVVGSVDVSERVKLSARRSGPIVAIDRNVGDSVNAGDIIVQVKSTDEQLALKQAKAVLQKAQADLALKLAGQSPESLQALSATAQQRAAELQKTKDDFVAAKSVQQITVKTQQQLVSDAEINVRLAAQSALTSVSTSLNDSDAILGVDSVTSNEAFRNNLSVKDPAALMSAKDAYRKTKGLRTQAMGEGGGSVEVYAKATDTALQSASVMLIAVTRVLESSVTGDTFTPATFNAKQTTITADHTTVATNQITVETKVQSLHTARLTQESAVNDANSAVIAKQNAVGVAQAAYDSAKATEQAGRVAPRDVDIAALEAQVVQARVQVLQAEQDVEDTIVRVPVAGTISDIPVKFGEIIAANQAVAELLAKGQLEIKANVPEVDIAKVAAGQNATLTLDAFGSSQEFVATVVAIDPAQTVVEGVATYTVTLQFKASDARIRPGMTANIDLLTAKREKALVIPQRAVRKTNGKIVVKVERATAVTEVAVTTGLVGSDGFIEVTSGLQEGEKVVVSGE